MRCFCVIGPSQSGKSTLVDHLAETGEGRRRTDMGGGLTLTRFDYCGEDWGAIDCPGSIELLPNAEQALSAADAAVLVVKPDPDAAAVVAPYLRAAERAGCPTLLFINRMDEATAWVRDIVAALQDVSSHPIVLRQVPIRTGDEITGAIDLVSERAWKYRDGLPSTLIEIPQSAVERESEARGGLLEDLSELSDWLLEELVEDREPAVGPLYAICTDALRGNAVTPAFLGSASHNNGVRRLMKALRHEAPPLDALRDRLAATAGDGEAPPLAVALNADHRKHLGKVVFLRSLGDGVGTGAPLGGATLGGLVETGGNGGASTVPPGVVAAVAKSDHLHAGDLLTAGGAHGLGRTGPPPMLSRALTPAHERDEAKLSTVLAKLADDEPGLSVTTEPGTGRHVVRVQGPGHLRDVQSRLSAVFGVDVVDHPVRDTFCESVTKTVSTHYRHRKQSGGSGQFADVKLTVAPAGRGEGFLFEETIKGGAVPRNYIPAVEAGAVDALAAGPMGFPVVDLRVTLTDGQHHSVDSSDLAFRIAGRLAVAKALAEAAPVLLQPIHRVACHAPSVFSGALAPLVSSLRGQVLGFERDPEAKGWDVFNALLPASALADLPQQLRAATQGSGWFEHAFDHFEEVYGKEADRIVKTAGAPAIA